jgi:hypothetical protein
MSHYRTTHESDAVKLLSAAEKFVSDNKRLTVQLASPDRSFRLPPLGQPVHEEVQPMSLHGNHCEMAELVSAYTLHVLPASDVPAILAHIASCQDCRREVESLNPVVDQFVSWPTDVLRPTSALQGRLARRIAEETGTPPEAPPARRWAEPEWEQVAPGIECKLLATDQARHRVSMLVRLAPGTRYPGHTHAGTEELHLLDGELWIDDRKLCPGDYNYGAPGEHDERVWSETGCTCLLVTSTQDILS